MGIAPSPDPSERLLPQSPQEYGERFQDHLLEQYKMYVESSQKVSEKRISTGNYLLTVNSSLLTLFGVASTNRDIGGWLALIPVAGLLVSLTWYSLVESYKNLNTAKFKVIHEMEDRLPAALFRYEWHRCEQGQGRAYRPITHLERWIPLIFGVVFLALGVYSFFRAPTETDIPKPMSVNGSLDVTVKSPVVVEGIPAPSQPPQQKRSPKR